MATTAAAASSNPPAAGRPQLKGSIGGGSASNGNPNRRATQSPSDGGPQRRNSSKQPAWQSNAATQKFNGVAAPPPTSSSPTPGQAAAAVKNRTNAPGGTETETHDQHMHDRQLFLLSNLMSRTITVTVKSGAQYSGILSGVSTKQDLGVSLKYAKLVKAGLGDADEKTKEGQFVEGGHEKSIVFEPKDVVEISASDINLENSDLTARSHTNGTTATFKTDADISGNLAIRERELRPWQPEDTPDSGLALEDNSGRGWDQFAANERLFGLKTNFNEEEYTTKVDRSHPLYQQREREAAKLAAEIEGGTYVNAHVAEERGLAVPDDSGMDEEDKYSGVQRNNAAMASSNSNRYTPPARRAPTGQPTVPGAPHDPAIISSQLARPETIQQKQQQQQHQAQPAQQLPQQQPAPIPQPLPTTKSSDDITATKPKERVGLPAAIPAVRTSVPPGNNIPVEKEVSQTFKNFVNAEKERVKKKKQDMQSRDRETKLKELKKFSESFNLKSLVPDDLVPILAKDKAKQQEIKEKSKANLAKPAAVPPMPTVSSSASAVATAGLQPKPQKQLPSNSFAAKNPERFARDTQALLSSLPLKLRNPEQVGLAASLQRMQQQKGNYPPPKPPQPIPEFGRPNPPTGPAAAAMQPPSSGSSVVPKRFNVNAKPFEYKPNVQAFVPSFGPASNGTPSPTLSGPQGNSRVASPGGSPFFGNKKFKPVHERPSVITDFNPFKRMKTAAAQADGSKKKTKGPGNDWVIPPWVTTPVWLTPDEEQQKEKNELKKRSYKELFGQLMSNIHSPQPPHMMPPQPHHQQLPPHMPHMNQPHHVPHQPPHGPMQPPHLGLPHYEGDHIRSQPPSVMPSPSLHHASTVQTYQQSPVPHPAQPVYPGQQVMGPYGGAVNPQFGGYYHQGGGFRGPAGTPHMIMPGAPQPGMPFPGQQMGGQYAMQPPMYGSPQQPYSHLHSGPPPPAQQGYHSPRAATLMVHQGSSQGTPGQMHAVPYNMQPGQGGPMYGPPQGGQQQPMAIMGGRPMPHGGPPPQFYHGPGPTGPQGPPFPPGGAGRGYHAGPPPPQTQGPPPPQGPQQMQPAPPQPPQPPQQPAADAEEAK